MELDSVSRGFGADRPIAIFKPSSETGKFNGRLGTSTVTGNRLAVHGLSADQVSAIEDGDTKVLATVFRPVPEIGQVMLVGCKAAIMQGLRSTRISGSTVTEVMPTT